MRISDWSSDVCSSDLDDFLVLRIASGPAPWDPPVPAPDRKSHHEAVAAAIEEHRTIPDAAVPVSLRDHGVVGLVGDRAAAMAVARSLVAQATVLSGPADPVVAVFTDADPRRDWGWGQWPPHAPDPTPAT